MFAPSIARRLSEAYATAGGRVELRVVPALARDGHNLMELVDGRVHWLAALDPFLRAHGLPTWSSGQVDAVLNAMRLPPTSRGFCREVSFALHAQGSHPDAQWDPELLGQHPRHCCGPGGRAGTVRAKKRCAMQGRHGKFRSNAAGRSERAGASPAVKTILERVATWPEKDQEELAEVAREIEARRTGIYELTPDEEAAIREGIADLDHGRSIGEDEMRAFWKRCSVL